MSFLENMAATGLSNMLSNSTNPMAASVLEMINSHPGGLSGLIQSFQEKGLGEVISSWVSTGQNLPVSSDQIQQVLSSQQVQNLAARAGVSPDTITSQLSQFLPTLVDKLTPDGQIPSQESFLEKGMDFLKSFSEQNPAA